jgi:phosphatidate phosphatase APP1
LIFFPTYASYDEAADRWTADLHAWAYRVVSNSRSRRTVARLFRRALGLKKEHANEPLFQRRAALFLTDTVKHRRVAVRLGGMTYDLGQTAKSGHLTASLELPGQLIAMHAEAGVLRFEPNEPQAPPSVPVRLIEPRGVSVISDIDDTIKASYVWKKRKLIRTTFTRVWKPTRGLPEVYRRWAAAGAQFHYVSTTPWQLYPSLAQFVQRVGYPLGTFHLKRLRWKDRSFFDLFAKADKYKPKLLEPILERFPQRRFVLVGDSGENDPEIYGALARRLGEQIAAILIRNVTRQGEDDPRYEVAFAGLPRERWQVFDKAVEIRSPAVLPSAIPAEGDAGQEAAA